MEKLKLILDTNIIISALIKDTSIIRDILVSNKIKFFAPEFVMEEIEKYRGTIQKKSGLSEIDFYFTLGYLLRGVKIIKKECFSKNLQKAKKIMKDIDIYDPEFLALAMSIPNDGIFSNDDHFDKTEIKRWSVMDVVDWLEKHEFK
ncbi:MAG: hypothetical protein A7316_03825 [Candidatus Altiarchaeales archaeon WOR_SM1_86-2]|nr:MAG: hypothetical protein A7316_03825 [Candidatus Altiarchaeales archaeon WOR_SM1_86-2]ODS37738.1 MAG: hypothetical protein A7315_03830 [Candidatus Altiarchaeales archaeon WOR_SM1_79]